VILVKQDANSGISSNGWELEMMLSQKKYKLRIRNKVSVVVVRYGEGEVNIWYQYPKAVMQSCDSHRPMASDRVSHKSQWSSAMWKLLGSTPSTVYMLSKS
jgi:hypothetical protein